MARLMIFILSVFAMISACKQGSGVSSTAAVAGKACTQSDLQNLQSQLAELQKNKPEEPLVGGREDDGMTSFADSQIASLEAQIAACKNEAASADGQAPTSEMEFESKCTAAGGTFNNRYLPYQCDCSEGRSITLNPSIAGDTSCNQNAGPLQNEANACANVSGAQWDVAKGVCYCTANPESRSGNLWSIKNTLSCTVGLGPNGGIYTQNECPIDKWEKGSDGICRPYYKCKADEYLTMSYECEKQPTNDGPVTACKPDEIKTTLGTCIKADEWDDSISSSGFIDQDKDNIADVSDKCVYPGATTKGEVHTSGVYIGCFEGQVPNR